ncbi:MAG: TIGR01777 family protein [Planctomycetes bacterium]|nr:TIGR01777 family protein [Planctomycetota bacterium]
MRIVLTGGTGFVGRVLTKELVAAGHRVVLLTRTTASDLPDGVEAVKCSVEEGPPDRTTLAAVDAVIHLAGESVSRRWSTAWKHRIMDSRVRTTQHLVQAMAALDQKPEVFVCASAIGLYGDRGPAYLDEGSEGGHGFLADVCRAWEDEARKAEALGIRVVRARIGMVLGPGGGALAKMLRPFKLGLGGPMGSGKQYISWIHRDDAASLLRHAVECDEVQGAMNVVSPHPLPQRKFAQALARRLSRPALLKAPAWALRLLLGEMANMVLAGQRVLPRVAEGTGYTFQQPDLKQALNEILALDDEARAQREAVKRADRERRARERAEARSAKEEKKRGEREAREQAKREAEARAAKEKERAAAQAAAEQERLAAEAAAATPVEEDSAATAASEPAPDPGDTSTTESASTRQEPGSSASNDLGS